MGTVRQHERPAVWHSAVGKTAIAASLVLTQLLAVVPAFACIWDRDTLSAEAIGLPEVVDVIVGRVDRPPDKYYEMRLKAVTARLLREPDNWPLYDDAGAAADRLHRGDQAIGWMERKRVSLKRVGTDDANHREHLYRYHANVGTFHAHRWLRTGAKRDRLDDLKLARQHIAEAIQLNPQAHFGRERYQLMAIEWLLESPDTKKDARAASLFWVARDRLGPEIVGKAGANKLGAAGYEDAVRGLAGLIVLGDAWESVDIHLALAQALNDQGNVAAASLAMLRVSELLVAGRRSLLSSNNAEKFKPIETQILAGNPYPSLRSFFRAASADAMVWRSDREDYVQQRLDAGLHPDSDAGFWKDYVASPPLRLQAQQKLGTPILWIFLVILAAPPFFSQWRRRRNTHVNTPAPDEAGGRGGNAVFNLGTAFVILIWLGILAGIRAGDKDVSSLAWLFVLSPLLVTGVWWASGRLMGSPNWARGVLFRHLGYAAFIWTVGGILLQMPAFNPDYHVVWKREPAN